MAPEVMGSVLQITPGFSTDEIYSIKRLACNSVYTKKIKMGKKVSPQDRGAGILKLGAPWIRSAQALASRSG